MISKLSPGFNTYFSCKSAFTSLLPWTVKQKVISPQKVIMVYLGVANKCGSVCVDTHTHTHTILGWPISVGVCARTHTHTHTHTHKSVSAKKMVWLLDHRAHDQLEHPWERVDSSQAWQECSARYKLSQWGGYLLAPKCMWRGKSCGFVWKMKMYGRDKNRFTEGGRA